MKKLYLLMAIIGSIVPYYFFLQFFGAEGVNLPLFVKALFPNGAAGGFSADLLAGGDGHMIVGGPQAKNIAQ